MQHSSLEGIGEAAGWLACEQFPDTIARMIEGLGNSWQAVVVSADVGELLAGRRAVQWSDAIWLAGVVVITIMIIAMIRSARVFLASVRKDRDTLAATARELDEMTALADQFATDRRHLLQGCDTLKLARQIEGLRVELQAAISPVTPLPLVIGEKPVIDAMPPITVTPEKSLLSKDSEPVMTPDNGEVSPKPLDRHDTRAKVTPSTTRKPVAKKVSQDPASLGDVAQWAEDNLEPAEKAEAQAKPLHQHYCDWCDARGKAPVTMYAFGLTMKELGWQKMQIAGRWYYQAAYRKRPLRVVEE